jgi:hypothetical protein
MRLRALIVCVSTAALAVRCKRPEPAVRAATIERRDARVAETPDAVEPVDASELAMGDAAPVEGRRCVVVYREPMLLGRRALLTSVSLRSFGETAVLTWIVPPLFAHGGDDLAALAVRQVMRYDVLAQREVPHSFYTYVLDAEEPSNARGLTRSPTNLYRVYAVPGQDQGSQTTGADQLSRDDDGNELVEAGTFSAMTATVSDAASDDVIARNIVRGAPYYARTAFDVVRPFVLGLRTADVPEQPSAEARFFATREDRPPADRSRDFWPLPIDSALVRRARNPAAALREFAPEGLEIAEVVGRGYAIAFRFRGRLFLGWLDRSLRAAGPLHAVTTLGGEPGRPRIAARGEEVLLVFADRPGPDAGASNYRLHGAYARFGEAPSRPSAIATGMEGTQHEFAPSLTLLRDDRWLVAFSYGPLEARAVTDRQDVYALVLSSDLSSSGDATRVNETSGSDPRTVRIGADDGVLVAWGEGTGLQRPIRAALLRCGAYGGDGGSR